MRVIYVWAVVFLALIAQGSGKLADPHRGSLDPYKILGVLRSSTQQDIRRAYKKAAIEWHPDKSDSPDAESRFVEIKQAYELLSDPERRRVYDQHGITNEDSSMFREGHDYSHYGRYAPDPFEEFFGAGGGGNGQRFHFDQDISLFHKMSITTRYFETTLLPRSEQTPHLIMFYSDWCFSCMKAAPSFKKLIDTLSPVGTMFATVNAGHENGLVRRLGVHSLPCIVLVLDGRTYVYKESVFSIQKIVDFLRQKLPYKLIPTVKDSTVDSFLSGWTDNRVRALLLEPRAQPRLRYLLSAFQFRHRVAFGFVELNSDQSKSIKTRYQMNPSLDSLLLFNEDAKRPVASVTMSEIPLATLTDVIGTNQYLALPRLSSQSLLDGVCPAEWNRPRKKLCVILITDATAATETDQSLDLLRKIALESDFSKERVRFAYLIREKQSEFVSSLSKTKVDDKTKDEHSLANNNLVVIWRRDPTHVKYEWVVDAQLGVVNGSYNHTKQTIIETIQRLLKANEVMSNEAEVRDLLDEHAQGTFARIITKVLIAVEYLGDNLGEEHLWPAISVVATVAFILGVGYLMSHLVKMEEEAIKKKRKAGGNGETGEASASGDGTNTGTTGTKNNPNYVPELKLHELRAEKYNGLVRLLKPGCRTIILVTDMQSRNKLIPAFHKAVWPYRKNKTLMFGYMMIERGLSWYTDMLRISLSDTPDLQINPRNCIGTVIALNGHRKYFCMYHAKHPESNRGAKRMLKMQRHFSANMGGQGDPEAGSFLPYEDDSDCSDVSEPAILLEENLLDGCSNWLDRLFEGSTHRYYINYWPDFTTK